MAEASDKTKEALKHVIIYTDGGCDPNPGPGGYGIVLLFGEKRKEISGGFLKTTNNRMELTAAIVGLQTLRFRCTVTIYTDSQYMAYGISKGWAKNWRNKNWIKSDKSKAINPDLWETLLNLCDQHDVSFEWVRGHDGNPENERCDVLATQGQKIKDPPIDEHHLDSNLFFRKTCLQ